VPLYNALGILTISANTCRFYSKGVYGSATKFNSIITLIKYKITEINEHLSTRYSKFGLSIMGVACPLKGPVNLTSAYPLILKVL
jgi:hypothetical protein